MGFRAPKNYVLRHPSNPDSRALILIHIEAAARWSR
jgi:hypothetical protein